MVRSFTIAVAGSFAIAVGASHNNNNGAFATRWAVQTRGTCKYPINSAYECQQAAKQLRSPDNSVESDKQHKVWYDPLGCYYENKSLKYNVSHKNTGKCSYWDKCLCRTKPLTWAKKTKQHCAQTKAATTKYSTRAAAEAACGPNDNCSGIYDRGCDGRGPWYQCKKSPYLPSRITGSCVYQKNGSPSPPAPVLPYKLQVSGKCAYPLTSSTMCRAAALVLGLSDDTVTDDGQHGSVHYDPKGCYFESGNLKYKSRRLASAASSLEGTQFSSTLQAKALNTDSCTASNMCVCATKAPCPTVRCIPARPGCKYTVSRKLNRHGCPAYPCGILSCKTTTTTTTLSPLEAALRQCAQMSVAARTTYCGQHASSHSCANIKAVGDSPCACKKMWSGLTCAVSTCVCTKEYKPVICANGKEYGNQCAADCAEAAGCQSKFQAESRTVVSCPVGLGCASYTADGKKVDSTNCLPGANCAEHVLVTHPTIHTMMRVHGQSKANPDCKYKAGACGKDKVMSHSCRHNSQTHECKCSCFEPVQKVASPPKPSANQAVSSVGNWMKQITGQVKK